MGLESDLFLQRDAKHNGPWAVGELAARMVQLARADAVVCL